MVVSHNKKTQTDSLDKMAKEEGKKEEQQTKEDME